MYSQKKFHTLKFELNLLENGTKTHSISFESLDSGQKYSWRKGVWQHHGLATPPFPKKSNLS